MNVFDNAYDARQHFHDDLVAAMRIVHAQFPLDREPYASWFETEVAEFVRDAEARRTEEASRAWTVNVFK